MVARGWVSGAPKTHGWVCGFPKPTCVELRSHKAGWVVARDHRAGWVGPQSHKAGWVVPRSHKAGWVVPLSHRARWVEARLSSTAGSRLTNSANKTTRTSQMQHLTKSRNSFFCVVWLVWLWFNSFCHRLSHTPNQNDASCKTRPIFDFQKSFLTKVALLTVYIAVFQARGATPPAQSPGGKSDTGVSLEWQQGSSRIVYTRFWRASAWDYDEFIHGCMQEWLAETEFMKTHTGVYAECNKSANKSDETTLRVCWIDTGIHVFMVCVHTRMFAGVSTGVVAALLQELSMNAYMSVCRIFYMISCCYTCRLYTPPVALPIDWTSE